ncbi:undecaprenyl-diphosphatase [Filimonas zeae]|uniref:Phosphatase PAP2 family protein n=1 Tax=Filimonas zeae TaxID=1737353 RepID=A0A917IS50_9BACT|nr:phosphatase PAP2 family protein [Filimonas zeae]MDR6338322.1 undecaprenyl-diphosphatase [Filimonas zeae]GGH62837.1 phosphatase PAP2 family protein [Filimonas zeae]
MMLLNTNGFWMKLLAILNAGDTWLFLKINNEWTNSFLDSIFPWWRDSNTWIPLYFFLLLLVLYNFGWKCWPWIAGVIVTVALTDQISSTLLKNWINRPRPCNDFFLSQYVRLLLGRCPGSGSFTSSHAANHFGVACFMFFTMLPYFKKWGYLLFFWAATVSYGQVYIGVHYPLDIIGGAVLGSVIGYQLARVFNRRFAHMAFQTL